jgi:hypothetical protein
MKKQVVACVLAGAMAVSSLSVAAFASEDGTIAKEDLGWEWPEETITIHVYAGEGDQEEFLADEDGGKAYMDEWLLENMNVVFDWQYMTGDTTERLNLMLANGDYPAVITNVPDDVANKFIAQGKAVDLTPYLDQLPNLTRRMGNYLNMMKSDDGDIYKLPVLWGENPNVAGYDFGVRYDYWLELGDDEMYETPQEYIEVMKRILENHPTNDAGQTTYAFTSADQGKNFLNAMLGAYGFVNGFKVDENGEFTHWLNCEEGLEISKLVNQMYREGLIDPDYQSVDYETYISKQNSGQILGNLGTWWYAWVSGHQKWAISEGDDYVKTKRFANVSVHAEGLTMEDTSLLTSNFVGSYRMLITDNASQEEIDGIIKYLNWEASELGTFIMGFGAPSEENVWKIADDGTWLFDDEVMDVDHKDDTYHAIKSAHATEYWLAINAQWLKTDEYSNFDLIDPRVTRVSVYDYWPVNEDGSFADEGINICWGNYTAPAKDITMFTTSFDSRDMITTTKQMIQDTIDSAWANIINASSEEECIAEFEAARDDCNSMGLEELTDYYENAYRENCEKFEGE